jgi:hypothetical protein
LRIAAVLTVNIAAVVSALNAPTVIALTRVCDFVAAVSDWNFVVAINVRTTAEMTQCSFCDVAVRKVDFAFRVDLVRKDLGVFI